MHHETIEVSVLDSKERAYDRLVTQHKDAVYRQIARVCGNYDDAQDVLVETLLAAYRSIDQVRDPDAMRAWLATIGRRICRRLKSREALAPLFDLDGSNEPATIPALEEEMEHGRIRDCIHGALQDLPATYREVYVLRDIEGLTAEEAAKRLNISVRNLKSRLHRARRRIREALDQGLCGTDLAA